MCRDCLQDPDALRSPSSASTVEEGEKNDRASLRINGVIEKVEDEPIELRVARVEDRQEETRPRRWQCGEPLPRFHNNGCDARQAFFGNGVEYR